MKHLYFKGLRASVVVLGCIGASACGNRGDLGGEQASKTGIAAQALASDGTDVNGIRFDVTSVSCDTGYPLGAATSETAPIDPDQTLPGNLADFQNAPLDSGSSHSFADSFIVLPAGCYDVVATPVTSDGSDSADCASALKNGVVVTAGKTTEIFLVNQCKGTSPGALDAVATLNHPPTIDDVSFSDSKFQCGSPGQVCAKASDPDSDPIELELTSADCQVAVADQTEPPGQQCWEVTCSTLGRHDLTVTAYDLLHGATSDPERIEDWLAEQGYAHDSHASLDFWQYVDGIQLWPDKDGDGHGDAKADATVFCNGDDTKGFVASHDDCDDSNPNVFDTCATKCDDPWVCDGSHSVPVCKTCDNGGESICFKTTPDGDGLCTDNFLCAGKAKCTSATDCAAGQECVIDSCCDAVGSGVGTCVTPQTMCVLQQARTQSGPTGTER